MAFMYLGCIRTMPPKTKRDQRSARFSSCRGTASWRRAMTSANSGESDEPSPFDHIVDDETPRIESTDWACAQIEGGRTPEDVAAELVANGWSAADAEE